MEYELINPSDPYTFMADDLEIAALVVFTFGTAYGAKPKDGGEQDGNPYFIQATLRTYSDDNRLTFTSYGSCMKDSFGYRDMMKILECANAPVVKPGQEILVCIINSKEGLAWPPVLLKTGDKVSPFCTTPLTLEAYTVEGGGNQK